MSDGEATSPLMSDQVDRAKTPEVSRREEDNGHSEAENGKRRRHEDEEYDREKRKRTRRDGETEEEYQARKRARREGENEEDYDLRMKRYDEKEKETPEEREARHRKRREREREREEEESGSRRHRGSRRERSTSRGSLKSHRSHRSSMRDVDADRERDRDRRRERDYYEAPRRGDDRRYERRDYGDRYAPDYGRRGADRYEPPPNQASPPPRRRRRSPSYDGPKREGSTEPIPRKDRDEADELLESVDSEARSVFVSQLAAALTSRDLGMFFEQMLGKGSVRDARVVSDRNTRRSKGIAYVELSSVENVTKAMGLTGTVVMGLPIMISHSESEKNNQASTNVPALPGAPTTGPGSLPQLVVRPNMPVSDIGPLLPNGQARDANADAAIPYHRLYVGNLYYNLTAEDIRQVFEPFGELAFVDMPMEPMTNRSRGYAFVQFKELAPAEMALQSMNGFELASRQIKVSTVHERGSGGRPAGGSGQGNEQLDEGNNYGQKMDATARQQLMFKLARQPELGGGAATSTNSLPLPPRPNIPVQQTQFVQSQNMFDPSEETEPEWHKDLEEDIKEEVQAKYGQLVNIIVDKDSSTGDVYMHFVDVNAASAAVAGLNGRFFSGKQISASYIPEGIYRAHVP